MHAASNRRNAKVPVPIRTAMGARASKPRATMRTVSPGRKPNSARRRPTSAGAVESPEDTETTRAEAPGARSASAISMPFSAMNAILYENRSHYYYGTLSPFGRPLGRPDRLKGPNVFGGV